MERIVYTKDLDVKELFWRLDRNILELRFGDQRSKSTYAKRIEYIKEKIKEIGISLNLDGIKRCRFRRNGDTYIIRLI